MVEIILMRPAVTGFNALQGNQLREDELQQSGTVQVYQPFGRDGRQQYLVQLIRNALLGYDRDALLVAAQRLEGCHGAGTCLWRPVHLEERVYP